MSGMRFLSSVEAAALDVDLMSGEFGWGLEQLMELAGLSVAMAFANVFSTQGRILTICGPGNNGGDGLVAARHLKHFGYDPVIYTPKKSKVPFFAQLETQLRTLDVPFIDELPAAPLNTSYDYIIDAVFGFSFDSKSPIRAPFDQILHALHDKTPGLPKICSIDIPSGWDVEHGDILHLGMKPDMLISLTVPKKCVEHFQGPHHYVGGRFLPPKLALKYGIQPPRYPGYQQFVEMPLHQCVNSSSSEDNTDQSAAKRTKL